MNVVFSAHLLILALVILEISLMKNEMKNFTFNYKLLTNVL